MKFKIVLPIKGTRAFLRFTQSIIYISNTYWASYLEDKSKSANNKREFYN